MLGSAISAGASLYSGYMSRKAQAATNEMTSANAQKQMDMQKDFAQKGIRWRVNDAKLAGIHPLYALGASTPSYTPQSTAFTPETGLAQGLAAAGQDIGRAVNATRTAPERQTAFTTTLQGLQIKNMELDTQIKQTELASRLQRLSANNNPPMPTGTPFDVPEGKKIEDRPPLMMGGDRWLTNSNTSNMEDFEKRAGDEGPYNWLATLGVLWNDIKANYGEPANWPTKMVHESARQLSADAAREASNFKRLFHWLPAHGRR